MLHYVSLAESCCYIKMIQSSGKLEQEATAGNRIMILERGKKERSSVNYLPPKGSGRSL